jgi:acyl-CoA thioester hydrolase
MTVPSHKIFKYDYKVQLDDLDYQNHVNNAKWLTLFERARTAALEEAGFAIDWFLKNDIGLVIAHASLNYSAPATYGHTICIETQATEIGSSSMKAKQVAYLKDKLLVEAHITTVCVNSKGKPTRIPEILSAAILAI